MSTSASCVKPTSSLLPESGMFYAISAYLMWSLFPIYFKWLDHVSPFEIVAHRIFWSCIFMSVVVCVLRKHKTTFTLLKQPKLMFFLFISAMLVSINWLVFIVGVSQGKTLETSLGYFINPLISIVFGMVFFRERLRPMQWIAVTIALIAVSYQVVLVGEFPWIALSVAFSFAAYGAMRKFIEVDAIQGLLIETLWLSPLAVVYMLFLSNTGDFKLLTEDTSTVLLLLGTGLVTSLPLLGFTIGARRVSLTVIGLMQYTVPSITFMIAVFHFHEPMNVERLFTFVFIWIALIIFTVEGLHHRKQQRKRQGQSLIEQTPSP